MNEIMRGGEDSGCWLMSGFQQTLSAKEEGNEIEEEEERNGRAKKVVLTVTAVILENRVLISSHSTKKR